MHYDNNHLQYGRKFSYCGSLNDYILHKQLGEGTFGIVLKATSKKNKKLVAIKRFTVQDSSQGFHRSSVREIAALKFFKHQNLIQLLDILGNESDNSVSLVFPYMNCDLSGILSNKHISFRASEIKNLMLQILEGINFIHSNNFIHRDIKTSNILISIDNVVKIADFGLTRRVDGYDKNVMKRQDLTTLVVARWYRAPELLLGDSHYTFAIDMWAIGLIFGEFFIRKPLLTGSNDMEQLNEIFKLVGSPKNKMPLFDKLMNENLLNENYMSEKSSNDVINLKKIKYKVEPSLFETFRMLDSNALNFFTSMLVLDPNKRLTARDALQHIYFKQEPTPCINKEMQVFKPRHELDIKQERKNKLNNDLVDNNNDNKYENTVYDLGNKTHDTDYENYDSSNEKNNDVYDYDNNAYGDFVPSASKIQGDNILDYLGIDSMFSKPKFHKSRQRSNSNNSALSSHSMGYISNFAAKKSVSHSAGLSINRFRNEIQHPQHSPGIPLSGSTKSSFIVEEPKKLQNSVRNHEKRPSESSLSAPRTTQYHNRHLSTNSQEDNVSFHSAISNVSNLSNISTQSQNSLQKIKNTENLNDISWSSSPGFNFSQPMTPSPISKYSIANSFSSETSGENLKTLKKSGLLKDMSKLFDDEGSLDSKLSQPSPSFLPPPTISKNDYGSIPGSPVASGSSSPLSLSSLKQSISVSNLSSLFKSKKKENDITPKLESVPRFSKLEKPSKLFRK